MRRVFLLMAMFLLGSPLAGQSTGGAWIADSHYSQEDPAIARSSALIGDIDSDGFPDFVVGTSIQSSSHPKGEAWVASGRTGQILLRVYGQPNSFDSFGEFVGGGGDVNGDGVPDFIVGAPYGLGNGSAHVYSGSDGSELYAKYGVSSPTFFGRAVSIVGDLDSDGCAEFAVGAPQDVWGAGKVTIFSGATGSEYAQLVDPGSTYWFGNTISQGTDFDHDGIPDFLVASLGDPSVHANVSLYSGATLSRLMTSQSLRTHDLYGDSLAIVPDMDGDQTPDIVVGAPNFNGPGSAYILSGATGSTIAWLTAPTPYFGAYFGTSVGYSPDVDGDGTIEILVGDHEAVHFFSPRSSGVASISSIDARDVGASHIRLGSSVQGVPDVDGDGLAEVFTTGTPSVSGTGDGGFYLLRCLDPFLSLSEPRLSAASGGKIGFAIDFPDSEAGANYILLASFTGAGPSYFGGGFIPLSLDMATFRMSRMPPSYFLRSIGQLSSHGDATAWMRPRPGVLSGLVGTTVWFAAVLHDGFGGVRRSSIPRTVQIGL